MSAHQQGKTYTGSIVGVLDGTLDTVKSDETVKIEIVKHNSTSGNKEYNGGMVGVVPTNAVIRNCWFAGKLNGDTSRQGGILGGLQNASNTNATNCPVDIECTIENCLVTGEFKVPTHVGGIFGTAWYGGTLTLKDSLFAGKIAKSDGTAPSSSGTVIDDVGKLKPIVSNVYSQKYEGEVLAATVGVGVGNIPSGAIKAYSTDELKGESAYDYMNVKFYPKDEEDAPWIAVTGSHPVLRSFVDEE